MILNQKDLNNSIEYIEGETLKEKRKTLGKWISKTNNNVFARKRTELEDEFWNHYEALSLKIKEFVKDYPDDTNSIYLIRALTQLLQRLLIKSLANDDDDKEKQLLSIANNAYCNTVVYNFEDVGKPRADKEVVTNISKALGHIENTMDFLGLQLEYVKIKGCDSDVE